MNYKLYDNKNNGNYHDYVKQVLSNRGIEDVDRYMNLTSKEIIPYENLDNMDKAVELFMKHFYHTPLDRWGVLVDSDPDGFCSAAMVYSYVSKIMDDDNNDKKTKYNEPYHMNYILHTLPKRHGLTSEIMNSHVLDDIDFLIIPDASTNDVRQCKELTENGKEILILDHHEKTVDNPYAVIVNNQISKNYPNKDFCGAGIVYKFLQALDEELWCEYADDYLDLCALANISDVIDMRSYETKYIVELGLHKIQNKCFQALIDLSDYSMHGKVNIHNVQWSITPLLNGMIRFGSLEEQDLLFRALIEQNEVFDYKKKTTKNNPAMIVQEDIYTRVARLCKNAKSRQDKEKNKCVTQILGILDKAYDGLDNIDDKVVVFDGSSIINSRLTGVVANKIADELHRPFILLQKHMDEDSGKWYLNGSGRNINYSPIENLRDIVTQTGYAHGEGHASAFGVVDLNIDDVFAFREKLNELLKYVVFENSYYVDFEASVDDVDTSFIYELSALDDYLGQGISEPMVCVDDILLTKDDIEVIGKNEDTVTFTINNVKYIKFKCDKFDDLLTFANYIDKDRYIELYLIGKPYINEYNGVKTPQIIIEDYEVINYGYSTLCKNEECSDDEEDEWGDSIW